MRPRLGWACRSRTSVRPLPTATRCAASGSRRTSRPPPRSCAATRRRTSPGRRCTSTEAPSLSPEPVRRSGAPPGFKPLHLVIGVVVLVAWFGVLAFVLTQGHDEASSVDVYSELPPGFTGALQAKGVTYTGLSPVDAATQQQALAHLPALGNDNGGKPLVF